MVQMTVTPAAFLVALALLLSVVHPALLVHAVLILSGELTLVAVVGIVFLRRRPACAHVQLWRRA
jgi:hypothetical protein